MKNFALVASLGLPSSVTAFVSTQKTFFPKPMTNFFDARFSPASSFSSLKAAQPSSNDAFTGFYSSQSQPNSEFSANRGVNVGVDSRERSKYTTDSYTRELEERLMQLEKSLGKPQAKTTVNAAPTTNAKTEVVKEPQKYRDNSDGEVVVHGDSLKTWSIPSGAVEKVFVKMSTSGRPLEAEVELWQGPDNTPQRIRVYNEDGSARPFSCVLMTPRGPNTLAVRNTGPMEFPMNALVSTTEVGAFDDLMSSDTEPPRTIQGGALRTFPFDSFVESVQVFLQTDGRPLNARVELLQGPNNNKQVIDVFTEDGNVRPFYIVIETPGSGNVVRILNLSTVEFPLAASVEPYIVASSDPNGMEDVVMGGDGGRSAKW